MATKYKKSRTLTQIGKNPLQFVNVHGEDLSDSGVSLGGEIPFLASDCSFQIKDYVVDFHDDDLYVAIFLHHPKNSSSLKSRLM